MSVNCKESKPKSKLNNLLDSSSSASSDDDDNSQSSSNSLLKASNTANITSNTIQQQQQPVKKGIYSQVINQTKQNIRNTHSKFDRVDKKIIPQISEVDKENTANNEKKKIKKKIKKSSDSSCSDSDVSVVSTSKSISSTSKPSSDEDNDDDECKIDSKKEKQNKSLSPPAPPPPPVKVAKKKRKSSNIVDRQLKELDKIKNLHTASFNSSAIEVNNDLEEEILSLFTVRVSMKTGVQRFEIKKNDQFLKIYENISKIENTGIENIVLMHKEKKIEFNDTPESINLQTAEILDFNKINGKKIERIQIIETNNEEETRNDLPNKIIITLQTSEGRKSRISFLVFKEESFENILRKYCEKKEISDCKSYMMEFDGDKVDLTENANDLDLEGGEIFDVKKSTGSSLDVVKSNINNYEFDDDILIA